jgi:DNA-binding transcriptional regulator YhcF (GntR family)
MPNLNIRISQRSGETKTAQIFNQIASAILAGKFNPGDSITSERGLAEKLGVSRNIVRNAYRRLEEAGLLESSSTSNRRVRASGKRRAPGVAGVSRHDRLSLAGKVGNIGRGAAPGGGRQAAARGGDDAAKRATGTKRAAAARRA